MGFNVRLQIRFISENGSLWQLTYITLFDIKHEPLTLKPLRPLRPEAPFVRKPCQKQVQKAGFCDPDFHLRQVVV